MTDLRPYFTHIIGHNSVYVHRIPTKVGTEICLNEPFKCAKFQPYPSFYGRFCEVCKMKNTKKKKTKKLKRNFVRSYLGNGWTDFLQIWYVDSHNWPAQQIWFQSDKGSQNYIGVKIAFSFFLLIYSRCGVPVSWAARHTIMCLDLHETNYEVHNMHVCMHTLTRIPYNVYCYTKVSLRFIHQDTSI